MGDLFRSELSFNATLIWNESAMVGHAVGAGFDGGTPLKHGDGWLHAGLDVFSGHRNPANVVSYVDQLDFWFGCYGVPGDYVYEIRGISLGRIKRFHGYQIDVSRNGYLGMYPESYLDMPLWRIDSLDPHSLVPGSLLGGIKLVSPNGREVKRVYEDRFPYLNDQKGDAVTFSLGILKTNVPTP
jgi:hypothetical protein